MDGIVYFRLLAFFWAGLALGSRVLMGLLGKKWNQWEMSQVYQKDRPAFLMVIGAGGIVLVLVTWYMVFVTNAPYGWVLALLQTLTLVKIGALLLRYEAFRDFAQRTLNDSARMRRLNVLVLALAVLLIVLGVVVYS